MSAFRGFVTIFLSETWEKKNIYIYMQCLSDIANGGENFQMQNEECSKSKVCFKTCICGEAIFQLTEAF